MNPKSPTDSNAKNRQNRPNPMDIPFLEAVAPNRPTAAPMPPSISPQSPPRPAVPARAETTHVPAASDPTSRIAESPSVPAPAPISVLEKPVPMPSAPESQIQPVPGQPADTPNHAKDFFKSQIMMKSSGIAAILTFFFGGVGLLYLSIPLGLIGLVIDIAIAIICVFTVGLGLLFVALPWHIFCVILAIILANWKNKKILAKM